MAFDDGILVFRQSGALPSDAFEKLVEQVVALDMDAMKADLAKQESGQK